MAVPKRKTSISKKKMRRSHHKLSSVNIVEDKIMLLMNKVFVNGTEKTHIL